MPPAAAVIATVNLFHLCVDRREWDTARSCLADVVRFAPDGRAEVQDLPGEQFLAAIRANAEAYPATQHLVAGHHVTLESDTEARCVASFQFHHVTGTERWVLAGQQELHLHRTQDTWRIAAVKLSPAWEEGKHESKVESRES